MGYVRNHILVSTTKDGKPIGSLPVDGVGKKELQDFELSLYKQRVAYRLISDPFQINVADYVAGKEPPQIRSIPTSSYPNNSPEDYQVHGCCCGMVPPRAR